MKLRSKVALCGATLSLGLIGASVDAATWGSYHWARKSNPMTIKVIDSLTPEWDSSFLGALKEWSYSTMLDLTMVPGDSSATLRQSCPLVQGQVRVCNYAYGTTGWLGLASIGVDANGHIDKGRAKLNDSYSSYWAIEGERNHVMCQEIGHVFGLDHTSENGTSQATCMDYSTSITSQWPNGGDYDTLVQIYGGHTDSYNSYTLPTTTAPGDTTTSPTPEPEPDAGTDPAPKTCSARGKSSKNKCTASTTPESDPPAETCTSPGNSNKCTATSSASIDAQMGVKIGSNAKREMWVARRDDGGIWIHILYMANHEHDPALGHAGHKH